MFRLLCTYILIATKGKRFSFRIYHLLSKPLVLVPVIRSKHELYPVEWALNSIRKRLIIPRHSGHYFFCKLSKHTCKLFSLINKAKISINYICLSFNVYINVIVQRPCSKLYSYLVLHNVSAPKLTKVVQGG